jgi:hypothetical protein
MARASRGDPLKKDIMLARLRKTLRAVFNQPIPMTVLIDPDKATYAPEEVPKIVLDTYLMALSDVLDFIEGHTSNVEELLTLNGKAVVVDTTQKLFVVRVLKEDVIFEGHSS